MRQLRRAFIVALVSSALACLGCSSSDDDDSNGTGDVYTVESGRYVVDELYGHEPSDETILMAIELVVDRTVETARFELDGGGEVAVTLSARTSTATCCCTMDSCAEMEVLDLSVDPLVLESMTFDLPVMLNVFPTGNGTLVLREDDGSNQLHYPQEKHIVFVPSP